MDRRKILVEWRKGRQQRQQGSRRGGFDDQLFAFLAHDGILAREFELARNPHRLVSTVLEEFDVASEGHVLPLLADGEANANAAGLSTPSWPTRDRHVIANVAGLAKRTQLWIESGGVEWWRGGHATEEDA